MLSVSIKYNLSLTPQEFRLVSAALRGTLKEEWKEEAEELQNRLFQERNKQVKSMLENIDKNSPD
jgi:hypothetical protein